MNRSFKFRLIGQLCTALKPPSDEGGGFAARQRRRERNKENVQNFLKATEKTPIFLSLSQKSVPKSRFLPAPSSEGALMRSTIQQPAKLEFGAQQERYRAGQGSHDTHCPVHALSAGTTRIRTESGRWLRPRIAGYRAHGSSPAFGAAAGGYPVPRSCRPVPPGSRRHCGRWRAGGRSSGRSCLR